MTATAPRKMAPPVPRAERLRQIEAGRAAGLTYRQIADVLGISFSAVSNVINDPDGSKQRARRDSYAGECVDCGGETRSNGTKRPSERCPACAQAASVKWTHEAILAAFRDFADRYGRAPRVYDLLPALARQAMGKIKSPERKQLHQEAIDRFYTDACWPSAATVLEVFGSFGAALQAAGMPTNPRSPRWSPELIIRHIRDWADSHDGQPPRPIDWKRAHADWPSSSIVAYHFDSFAAAVEAAGFTPSSAREWDRSSILEAIKTYTETQGYPPKVVAFTSANGLPAYSTVSSVFGSGAAAFEAAGLPPIARRDWSRDRIAAVLRAWRDEHGDWPKATDFLGRRPAGYPSYTAVYSHFGSWAAAIAYAEQTP